MICSRWRVTRIAIVALSVCAPVFAQERAGVVVPEGASLAIQLETSVRTDRAKTGDAVRAQLVAPVLMRGKVAIPAGAKITGVVLETQRLALDKPSRLSLRFDRIEWKNGSAALSAYVTRQLVIKRTYEYQSRAFCPPVERMLAPQQTRTTPPQQPSTPPQQPAPPPATAPPPSVPPVFGQPNVPPPPSSDICHVPTGTRREEMRPLTFTSPAISGVSLRKLDSPEGATVLESTKKNVSLGKGMMLEIRQVTTSR